MTSKDRFLTAIRDQVPDRVPVAPDISNYIPAKRTGLPFWEIYFKGTVPLWRAYLEAMDHYGGDAWVASCMGPPLIWENPSVTSTINDVYHPEMDAMVRHTTIQTPDGPLTSASTCFRFDPPSPTERPIKDFTRDWKRFKWLKHPPASLDTKMVDSLRQACQSRQQAFGLCVGYPGFHAWEGQVQGGIEALTYGMMDFPAIFDEWFELDMQLGTRVTELALAAKPDYLLLGGSGTITMASPDLAMKFAIPALRKWSKMAKDAGVPTMLHSCGKSRVLVDMLAEHTDVGMINPLEIAPMGDVDLAEAKRARGRQIGLMGNLHTTAVMLRGTPDLVRRKALEAMRDAGQGGGFILSTGDQCPRDTPEENLFALIETAKEFGTYDRATGGLPLVEEALSIGAHG